LLAATASLGAYLAMLHAVLAVLLTFVTANLAGFGTGLERGPDQLGLEGRLAGENASRGELHLDIAGCASCGFSVEGAGLRTLEQIAALPEAVGAHACECGHPEMRRLPDGVFHCPAWRRGSRC
jgi:hypothetical protein